MNTLDEMLNRRLLTKQPAAGQDVKPAVPAAPVAEAV